jgi:hypothetical protein
MKEDDSLTFILVNVKMISRAVQNELADRLRLRCAIETTLI